MTPPRARDRLDQLNRYLIGFRDSRHDALTRENYAKEFLEEAWHMLDAVWEEVKTSQDPRHTLGCNGKVAFKNHMKGECLGLEVCQNFTRAYKHPGSMSITPLPTQQLPTSTGVVTVIDTEKMFTDAGLDRDAAMEDIYRGLTLFLNRF